MFSDRLPAQQLTWAAILYGLSVHMKIYPIMYALPIILTLRKSTVEEDDRGRGWRRLTHFIRSFLNRELFLFVSVSGGVFCLLTGLFYNM